MSQTFDLSQLPSRVLGVWAHPDDEAYLSAGFMARVTDAGHQVTVVTATRGEKGTSDPAEYDRPRFAIRREHELRACLAEVGVEDVLVLGYRDGECDLVDNETAITTIASVIEDVDPEVIITFGPDGITGHHDHRAVSRWTTEAWRRVGAGELLYATMSDDFVVQNEVLHDCIGVFVDLPDGPASLPADQMAMVHELDDNELDRKRRALGRHASQSDMLADRMGESNYRAWWRTEWFRRPTDDELVTSSITNRAALLDGTSREVA